MGQSPALGFQVGLPSFLKRYITEFYNYKPYTLLLIGV